MAVEGQINSSDKYYDLLFGVRRSVRYHHRRAGFFGGLHRTAIFASLFVAISAGVVATLDHGFIALFLSAVVALVAAFDVTMDSANSCARHMLLAYRFQELEKRFAREELSDEEFAELTKERLIIEQGEPVPMRLLDVMCHYELLVSMGHHKDRVPKVPLWRSLLANFASQTEYAQSLSDAS